MKEPIRLRQRVLLTKSLIRIVLALTPFIVFEASLFAVFIGNGGSFKSDWSMAVPLVSAGVSGLAVACAFAWMSRPARPARPLPPLPLPLPRAVPRSELVPLRRKRRAAMRRYFTDRQAQQADRFFGKN